MEMKSNLVRLVDTDAKNLSFSHKIQSAVAWCFVRYGSIGDEWNWSVDSHISGASASFIFDTEDKELEFKLTWL